MPNIPRKAIVAAASTPPGLTYWDSQLPVPPVSPPYLGGLQNGTGAFSGVYSMPPQGAQVLVLSEGSQAYGGMHPLGTVAISEAPGSLPALGAGETAIYGPSGQVLLTAKAAGLTLTNPALTSVPTSTSATAGTASALPAPPAGYLSIQLNGSTVKVPYYNP